MAIVDRADYLATVKNNGTSKYQTRYFQRPSDPNTDLLLGINL